MIRVILGVFGNITMQNDREKQSDHQNDQFWKVIESQMGYSIPVYIMNLLRIRGFENATTIKTLTVKDYEDLEVFARTKMEKYVPFGASRENYYNIFSRDPEAFEILPGHIKLLNQVVEHLKRMSSTCNKQTGKPNIPSLISQSRDQRKFYILSSDMTKYYCFFL